MSDNISSGKIIAALGAAIAAAAVSTIGLYFYLREEDDDDLLYRHIRRHNKTNTSFSVSDRVRVPRDVIGNVIGKGGEMVKKIQLETKTRIHFDENKDGSGDKFATISGTVEGIESAKDKINQIMIERSPENVFTEEVSVPYHLVGTLIGRQGNTIDSICKSSGAKINVPRSSSQSISGYIPVTIKGSLEQINEARRQVNQIIARSEPGPKAFAKIANGNGLRSPPAYPAVTSTPPSTSPVTGLNSENKLIESYKPEAWDEPLVEELIPNQDDMLQVYVSHVESPSRFWVQIYGPKSTALDKLSLDMTEYYQSNCRKERVKSIKVGDIVASQYNLDDTWYRVRVIEIDERLPADESDVKVYYLDFGGDSISKKKYICNLKHEYLIALPFQAVECCLNGVEPLITKQSDSNGNEEGNESQEQGSKVQKESTGKWSEEAIQFFADATHSAEWIEMLSRPHEKPNYDEDGTTKSRCAVSIDLYDFKDKPSGMVDIAALMISKGFAQRLEPEPEPHINGRQD